LKLAYYSLANSPGGCQEEQWIRSIRSLRRYSPDLAVALCLFNGASAELLAEAARCGVGVHYLGEYDAFLARLHPRGSVVALYPTFHKFLSLGCIAGDEVEQVLYLDCDTFFFDDVDRLFERYGACDWYAREEPMSRRSHYGYNAAHVDERVLDRIFAAEDLRAIAPFNSGVCVLNHQVWRGLQVIGGHFLDLAWRLLCGMALSNRPGVVRDDQIHAAVMGAMVERDRERALPFPSKNTWIVEQIALWLALGALPGMSQGFLSAEDVVQGGEYKEDVGAWRGYAIAHYYSTLEADFVAALPGLMG
jgi:hypothetical protein